MESDGTRVAANASLLDLGEGRVDLIAKPVGRSIQRVPGRRAVSFVHKESESEWWIMEYDVDSGQTRPVPRTLQGIVDHAWLPSGQLVAARDTKLFVLPPESGGDWTEAVDFGRSAFADAALRKITRITVSPTGDRLILVAKPG